MSAYEELFLELKKNAEKAQKRTFYVYTFVISAAIAFLVFSYFQIHKDYRELEVKYSALSDKLGRIQTDMSDFDQSLVKSQERLTGLIAGVEKSVQVDLYKAYNDLEDEVISNRKRVEALELRDAAGASIEN